MKSFGWVNPTSLTDALASLDEGAAIKAGGIDMMDLLKEGLIAPARLVNLRNVPGLDEIREEEAGLSIGALTTLARLASDEAVSVRYRALSDAAGHAATPQIRAVATLGGNLLQRPRCWYFRSALYDCKKKGGTTCFAQAGENAYHAIFGNAVCAAVHPSAIAVALIALGATLHIVGDAAPRDVPVASIFIAPDRDVTREHDLGPREIISEVRLPKPPPGMTSAYLKQGERESFDWPLAEVAVMLERDGETVKRAAIVLGAAAPIPLRASAAEALLVGSAIDEKSARAAAKLALKDARPLEHNGYKVPLFEALIRRTILAAASTT
jgi:xanthine dehydrogenase YagS FAD-binding subunit